MGDFTAKAIVAILGITVIAGTVTELAALIQGSASADHIAALGSDVKVDAQSNTPDSATVAANRSIATTAALSKIAPMLAALE